MCPLRIKKLITAVWWLLVSSLMACAPIPIEVPPVSEGPVAFKVAIPQLTKNIMAQLANNQSTGNQSTSGGWSWSKLKGKDQEASTNPPSNESTTVVFNPVIDVDSGQSVKVCLNIEEQFFAETRRNFKQFQIYRITKENLKNAHYVINGIIEYKSLPNRSEKHYRVAMSVIDWKNQTIVVKNQVWIAEDKLDFTPLLSAKANPMYVKGRSLNTLINIVNSPVGSPVSADFIQFIDLKSLLVDAQTAQDNEQDDRAIALYDQVLEQSGGKLMEAYGGRYAIYWKRGDLEKAEDNFYKMVAIGVEENGVIPIKFVFASGKPEFYDNPEVKKQYDFWLKLLSRYFEEHQGKCVELVGHTSKSAPPDKPNFNPELSENRATKIQKEMKKIFPGIVSRSKVTGKGSAETIVGTEPDDDSNAVDRRVEFKIIDCNSL